MFLVYPEIFSLKLLVWFLGSVSIPVFQNLKFLVSFWYPFWSYLGLPGFVPVPGNPILFVPYIVSYHTRQQILMKII